MHADYSNVRIKEVPETKAVHIDRKTENATVNFVNANQSIEILKTHRKISTHWRMYRITLKVIDGIFRFGTHLRNLRGLTHTMCD